MYELYYTHDAKNDYKKIIDTPYKRKIDDLLGLIKEEPFKIPPPYKKLVGAYAGAYSRRISLKHRLFYQVDAKGKRIKILRMLSHYGDN